MTHWIKECDGSRRMRHVATITADGKGNAEFHVDPPCRRFSFTSIDANCTRFGGPPFRVEISLPRGQRVIDRYLAPSDTESQPRVMAGGTAHIVALEGLCVRVTGQPLDVFSFVFTGESSEEVESKKEAAPAAIEPPAVPTPATHRYVGTWRPPLETIIERLQDGQAAGQIGECACGETLYASKDGVGGTVWPGERKEIFTHWLAGHFDEPQYEAKAT